MLTEAVVDAHECRAAVECLAERGGAGLRFVAAHESAAVDEHDQGRGRVGVLREPEIEHVAFVRAVFHVAQICCGQSAVRGRGLLGLAAELSGVFARLVLGKLAVLVRVGVGEAAQQAFELLLLIGRLRGRRRREPSTKNNRHNARQRLKVRQTNGKSLSRGRGHAPAGTKPKTDVTNSRYLCLHCGFLLLIGGCFPDAARSGGRFEMGLHFLIQPRSTRKPSASARVLA